MLKLVVRGRTQRVMWLRSRRNLNGAEGAVDFPDHEIEEMLNSLVSSLALW